jgi:uncharacterized protein YggE
MPAARVLAVTVLLALAAPALAQADDVDLRHTVQVSGTSTTVIDNDAARLRLGVQATRRTARGALQAASRSLSRVIASVRGKGVASEDIRTTRIGVHRLTRRLKSGRTQFRGYRATQGISVVAHTVLKVGAIVDGAVAAGASSVSGPDFFVFDTARVYRDALGLAFDDAKAKAQLLADRSGAKLGAVLDVIESPDSVTQENAGSGDNAAASTAPAPTQPGQSRVDATVGVVFELVPA